MSDYSLFVAGSFKNYMDIKGWVGDQSNGEVCNTNESFFTFLSTRGGKVVQKVKKSV